MKDVPPIAIEVTIERMRSTLKSHVDQILDPEAVKGAIDRAFAGFDIYAEIEKQARGAIVEVVKGQASDIAYPIREAIRKAAEKRVLELVAPLVQSIDISSCNKEHKA